MERDSGFGEELSLLRGGEKRRRGNLSLQHQLIFEIKLEKALEWNCMEAFSINKKSKM